MFLFFILVRVSLLVFVGLHFSFIILFHYHIIKIPPRMLHNTPFLRYEFSKKG